MNDNAAANMSEEEPLDATLDEDKPERGRSSIVFPYMALDEAVLVAKGVHSQGGTYCLIDQLAAQLKMAADSSRFRIYKNTARIFGLVTYTESTVTLTPLGIRICDPTQEPVARADAFLTVPLYAKIYDQFKGTNLPPDSGLETAMVNMGVAAKQKTSARQVFKRAAAQAGFFTYGNNRLVPPPKSGIAAAGVDPSIDHQPKPGDRPNGSGGGSGEGPLHPFIDGLIRTLPKPESDWPIEGRRKWLLAACSVFDLIYKGEDGAASIRVEIAKN